MNSYRIDWTSSKGRKGSTYVRSRSMFHALADFIVRNRDDRVMGIRFIPE